MKIIVTYERGNIYYHIGTSEMFKIYNVENNKVVSAEVVCGEGTGLMPLITFFKKVNADVIITDEACENAVAGFTANGFDIYPGIKGDADEAVENFLAGKYADLKNKPSIRHEDEHHD